MSQRCDGFILLMTLCIIFMMSLLLITCMQNALVYSKAVNQQEMLHQRFYQLEYQAIQIAQSPLLHNKCLIQASDPNQVIGQLMHAEGCILKVGAEHYRYLVEDLGDFPCLQVQKKQGKYASHHTRISIAVSSDALNTPEAVLQIRYINAALPQICPEDERVVMSGISSWRYLPELTSAPSLES